MFTEFGSHKIMVGAHKNFFSGKKFTRVWMSHADQVSKLPKKFNVVASSQNSKFAIVENTLNFKLSTKEINSLVVVFPLLPVTPTTGI